MSLATRCTACGTVFRVVQDQLKVSEGWVRCGRCNEVFSALEGLFDLDRNGSSDACDDASAGSGAHPGTTLSHADREDVPAAPMADHHPMAEMRGTDDDIVAAHEGAVDPTFAVTGTTADAASAHSDFASLGSEAPSGGAASEGSSDSALGSDTAAPPEFVREAQAQARWHRPWIRAMFATAALGLAASLVWQFGHHFRDTIAARYPAASSALETWCKTMACTIGPPRSIQDVLVDSTSLTRAPGLEAFTLSVALRNRSTIPVAMPSVELNLTDPTGQLVTRRVLLPSDFGVPSTWLKPGVDTALQLTLSVGSAGVTGYTVEIFNP